MLLVMLPGMAWGVRRRWEEIPQSKGDGKRGGKLG